MKRNNSIKAHPVYVRRSVDGQNRNISADMFRSRTYGGGKKKGKDKGKINGDNSRCEREGVAQFYKLNSMRKIHLKIPLRHNSALRVRLLFRRVAILSGSYNICVAFS